MHVIQISRSIYSELVQHILYEATLCKAFTFILASLLSNSKINIQI